MLQAEKRHLKIRPVYRICLDAMLLCLALALSYAELFIPINLIIPLPGFKLGFANIIIMLVFFLVSPKDALAVAFLRVGISSLLFGSVMSFCFSLGGAIMSLAGLFCVKYLLAGRISFVGTSVLSASLHNFGQITVAVIFYGPYVFISYLPVLLLASVVFGSAVGLAANAAAPRIDKFLRKEKK